jgi:hypothetical protein
MEIGTPGGSPLLASQHCLLKVRRLGKNLCKGESLMREVGVPGSSCPLDGQPYLKPNQNCADLHTYNTNIIMEDLRKLEQ